MRKRRRSSSSARRAIRESGLIFSAPTYIYLIATYAYLGQDAKADTARERVTELLRRQDRSLFTVKEVRNRMRYRYEADLLRLLVGLHKGHVPDSLF